MEGPIVTVICVCYNHVSYVREAIRSVLDQSYKNIELIVVDDGSTDKSVDTIKSMNVRLIDLKTNHGYTKAFNIAWRESKGDFIIDLAADDVLKIDRVRVGVQEFQKRDDTFGVQYGDALYIDEAGKAVRKHSDKFKASTHEDVYKELIERYFICSPTMMIRRSVLAELNGYDETLSYEDFDFWIRSSRTFRYFYTPQVLVKKRMVPGSMSDRQFKKGSPQQESTYKVIEKIRALNRTPEENEALRKRIKYEIRLSLKRFDLAFASRYYKLLGTLTP